MPCPCKTGVKHWYQTASNRLLNLNSIVVETVVSGFNPAQNGGGI
jgi:hypothetical protein